MKNVFSQSYHIGIEIFVDPAEGEEEGDSQSYHIGIEIKHCTAYHQSGPSLNRTILELKYERIKYLSEVYTLSIVPYWN